LRGGRRGPCSLLLLLLLLLLLGYGQLLLEGGGGVFEALPGGAQAGTHIVH